MYKNNIHHITSYHITSYHITSYHQITSYHITSHHIPSYHIISHHITYQPRPKLPNYWQSAPRHITSHHITYLPRPNLPHYWRSAPHHITSYHITSYHIIKSHHIISYHLPATTQSTALLTVSATSTNRSSSASMLLELSNILTWQIWHYVWRERGGYVRVRVVGLLCDGGGVWRWIRRF